VLLLLRRSSGSTVCILGCCDRLSFRGLAWGSNGARGQNSQAL
jgi:hypothetical protein